MKCRALIIKQDRSSVKQNFARGQVAPERRFIYIFDVAFSPLSITLSHIIFFPEKVEKTNDFTEKYALFLQLDT